MEIEIEIKNLLLEIRKELETLKFFIPDDISLSELSRLVHRENKTVYRYMRDNFEPEVDYKKKGGKIFVGKDTALCIRRHYAK